PDAGRFLRRLVRPQNGRGVEGVEQKWPDVAPQRPWSRLKHEVRDGLKALDPLPVLMSVKLLEMIEVALDPDRVVEPSQTVDNDPAFLRNLVQKACQVREIRKVTRNVDDEHREIELLDVERMRQPHLGMLFAENRDFVTKLAADLDILRNRVGAAREPREIIDEQELHSSPPVHPIGPRGSPTDV